MDESPSSKVTVEYHDPSGVFPLISSQLKYRFPLRNLHWKSPSRPLRSIDSLRVELVPSDGPSEDAVLSPPPETRESNDNIDRNSSSSQRPISSQGLTAKERRHQIPGLRQTPYLKVFLLRCDDSETYKTSSRKTLREWVRSHTVSTSASSSHNPQERHDAFEWLILHVVLPDTPAAAQPRLSGSTSGTISEKTRWPGRGSSTILEKIKSDFNISSKSAPDRVAQVRLQKDEIPPYLLPHLNLPPAPASTITSPYSESPKELENSWNDLIAKFKILILLSFDQRVSQYEDDIRERDSQRALPGWNFCTFFVLKEGLARGFENVGLVDDALVGYDELAVGLDTIVREQAATGSDSHGGSFLSYTEELQQYIVAMVESPDSKDIWKGKPISSNRKNYRDLILSNNISLFDFRCYIFSRQIALLSRLSNVGVTKPRLSSKAPTRPSTSIHQTTRDDLSVGTKQATSQEEMEDLLSLAEICARALNFISSISRSIRTDLQTGIAAAKVKVPTSVIDNFVSSWIFSVAKQIVEETTTPSIPVTAFTKDMTSSSDKSLSRAGSEPKVAVQEPKTLSHPIRSSSLSHRRTGNTEPPYALTPASSQVVYEGGTFGAENTNQHSEDTANQRSGLEDFVARRADLYLVQRRILENLGSKKGWKISWQALGQHLNATIGRMTEVDLNKTDELASETEISLPKHTGIYGKSLIEALSSMKNYRSLFEDLSSVALKHYFVAGRKHSAEGIKGDLAGLKFEMGDFASAASQFNQILPVYAKTRWNFIRTLMMRLYAHCLKELHRKDEYARVLLDLLIQSSNREQSPSASKLTAEQEDAGPSHDLNIPNWLNDDVQTTDGLLSELISFSDELPYAVTVPMARYFGNITVEPFIRHFEDKDGFQLKLRFMHRLNDELHLDKARVRLVCTTPGQNSEIWLDNADNVLIRRGAVNLWVRTNVTSCGPYVIDKIVLYAKKISFVHEPFQKSEVTTPLGLPGSASATSVKVAKSSRVLCFPRNGSFNVSVSHSRDIHIDKHKSLEIELESGSVDVSKIEFHIRAASAGLRLRTSDATTDDKLAVKDQSRTGIIELSQLLARSTAKLRLPYELEAPLHDVSVRLEIFYHTSQGKFIFSSFTTVEIELPLDVNVHDMFTASHITSRFNIRTANDTPLCIENIELQGSDEFDVQTAPPKNTRTIVFPKRPMLYPCDIVRKNISKSSNSNATLCLQIEYQRLNEIILHDLLDSFSRDLNGSPFEHLSRLLCPNLIEKSRQIFSLAQYERVLSSQNLEVATYTQLGWADVIEGLHPSVRSDLQQWLHKWHEQNKSIQITSIRDEMRLIPHRILITVPVPSVQIASTVSFTLQDHDLSLSKVPMMPVAEILSAKLSVTHTRQWDDRERLVGALSLSDTNDAVNFILEIEANPDTWLITGQRRVHFSARENETKEFPLGLLPLHPGLLYLPKVRIRPDVSRHRARAATDQQSTGVQDETSRLVTSEVDNLSDGDVVWVIPNVKSTTVGVCGFGTPESGTVVMASAAREISSVVGSS
ncbi:TMEM1 family protein-like protein [Patellaria atrata CBS 101060]|uniref:TMEM1 family protein-like protein n=1 Tax=Patellaria atrata CBS 101060 TaxID=1346257 RepID=A0A9P4S8D2_9PEZI|nr:TMEM1 family protein-like protein [Patellaria atrata CBS 101060]